MGVQSKHPPYVSTQLVSKVIKATREMELKKILNSKKVVTVLMRKDYTQIQILIFHYLGFLEMIDLPNTKKKLLLSIIFKTEGFENIRKKLSSISSIKTKGNLEVLQDLFDELNMNVPLKRVERDLIKLNKK